MPKDYDYLLKVLLVGDSDVGKHEIMAGLEDAASESPFCSRSGNCNRKFYCESGNQFKNFFCSTFSPLPQHIKSQQFY